MVVVPVDTYINKTNDVGKKFWNQRAQIFERSPPSGICSPRTIMVMMMARTLSLKASNRLVFIFTTFSQIKFKKVRNYYPHFFHNCLMMSWLWCPLVIGGHIEHINFRHAQT